MTQPIPAEMTYIRIDRFGPPEVLVPAPMAVPRPAPGEVLIKVAAAGDQPARRAAAPGRLPAAARRQRRSRPRGRGRDRGPGRGRRGLAGWRAGDGAGELRRLCRVLRRTRTAAPARSRRICRWSRRAACPRPTSRSGATSSSAAASRPGETLLVHGGSSGIGTTAIQLAKAFGATVLATVGGPDKQRACEELGAKRAIDYRREDFVEVAKAETGGKGVDVILDMVGGPYVERNLQALAVEGRLVQIAWLQGPKVTANFVTLMTKRLTWTGSTLRPRSVEQKGAIAAALKERVLPLLAVGRGEAADPQDLPLARGGGGARADGVERAYRQDRAHRRVTRAA